MRNYRLIFVFIQIKMARPEYTYNTVILFPAGCMFSLFHDRVEIMLKKWPSAFLYIGAILVIAYYVAFEQRNQYGIAGYTVWAFLFMALLIFFTMKVSIGNPFLDWIGDHIFGMFILQRIPMILLQKAGMTQHPYFYVAVCFACTLLLAEWFDRGTKELFRRLKI